MKRIFIVLMAATLFFSIASAASAGKIVLANDEWTLSETGFSNPVDDPGIFATNVAAWFAGGSSGSFLAYSNNFGFTGASLANAMAGAGYSWTVSTAGTFDLPTLSGYDGVFLGGFAADNSVLIDYVNAGGNVYLAGGTARLGSAAAEAAAWNTFLNNFGLGFDAPYNNVMGSIAVSSGHPIFNGVDSLYQNNGNNTLDLFALDPNNEVLVSLNGNGLYAIYESAAAQVPEAATLLLLGAGLACVAGIGRKKRIK